MSTPLKDHRRQRAWQTVYFSRLNACYWKKILAHRQRVWVWLIWAAALVVLLIAVSPFVLGIAWNPALITAGITFGAALLGAFPISAQRNQAIAYSKQWCELRHDSELLWQEGDDLGWSRQNVIAQLERLDARRREYEANEREQQDTRIVVECERDLYEQQGLPFPSQGVQDNG